MFKAADGENTSSSTAAAQQMLAAELLFVITPGQASMPWRHCCVLIVTSVGKVLTTIEQPREKGGGAIYALFLCCSTKFSRVTSLLWFEQTLDEAASVLVLLAPARGSPPGERGGGMC